VRILVTGGAGFISVVAAELESIIATAWEWQQKHP